MQRLRLSRASGIQNKFNKFTKFTMFLMKRKRNPPESLMILLLLLVNRIPVLQSRVTIAENPTARSTNHNAKPRMPDVKNVK